MKILLAAALLAASPAAAAPATAPATLAASASTPRAAADDVSEARLHATVEALVGFGTRHTLSSQTDPKRGIGAALRWAQDAFASDSQACGGCLAIVTPAETFTGRRSPAGVSVHDVVAIQRGTGDPNRVILITGHIDSRVSDVMNATADAPGANDDGSGTAAVLEAARILSRYRFPATIVYGVLMGEEQGLYGGQTLANYARAQGWQVEAELNNDIIGNSLGSDGLRDDTHVRLLSEGVRGDWTPDYIAAQRSLGGENDSPSRNLSRFVAGVESRLQLGLAVRQIWRTDRFGRGGDHIPFQQLGFPAVRFTVALENYNWQHQDLRTENAIRYGDTIDRMDFPYLRKVVQLNVAALVALASAPPPPEPKVEGAVSTDTILTWPAESAAAYVVHWRPTDAAGWTQKVRVPAGAACSNGARSAGEGEHSVPAQAGVAPACSRKLPHVRVDDWVFGVSSVSADGFESPVASAVPGGAFRPIPPAPAARP